MKITVKQLRSIIQETMSAVHGSPAAARGREVGEADAFLKMAKVNDAIRAMEELSNARDPELSAAVQAALQALYDCQDLMSNRRDAFSGASIRKQFTR
jgi:hypothetical protein